MIDHGGHVAARIILGNVPDRVQVVRQGPLYGFVSAVVKIFLGQNLVHRWTPQVTPLQITCLNQAGARPPKVHHHLVAIIGQVLFLFVVPVSVEVAQFPDQSVCMVVPATRRRSKPAVILHKSPFK